MKKLQEKKLQLYNYCRISTAGQVIDRQVTNGRKFAKDNYGDEAAQDMIVVKEVFTGTKVEGRKKFNNLIKTLERCADKIQQVVIFDECSRMSRNVDEAIQIYHHLHDLGITLIFIKERNISTDVYDSTLQAQHIELQEDGSIVNILLEAINKYLRALCEEQIRLAFKTAQHETDFLKLRTKEGIEEAKLSGKSLGHPKGKKNRISDKKRECIEKIKQLYKIFDGNLGYKDMCKLLGISKVTFFRYVTIIKEQMQEENKLDLTTGEQK